MKPVLSGQSECSRVDTPVSYIISSHIETPFDHSALSLPSKDYITHLAQVTNYHLNANCYFFDQPFFLEQLSRTPPESLSEASELWKTELLLVVALGKLFLGRGATSLGPPGVREFVQGSNILPSNIVLSREPIMAMETLCLLAIYAQAADMHRIAYLYVRICSWPSLDT